MAENFNVNGLLDKLLGGEPSSVAGFVDNDEYSSQKSFDRLLGGARGYTEAVNSGSGIATTLLNTLKSAQEGGRKTDNIYLNALKGQQQLTKGMLDVQKIQADLTKLGFENSDLARMSSQNRNDLLNAFLSGDTNKIRKIKLLGMKEYGKSEFPEPEKTPYAITQLIKVLDNQGVPKKDQARMILEYTEASTGLEKAKFNTEFFDKIGSKYPLKKGPYISSQSDVSSKKNISNNLNLRTIEEQKNEPGSSVISVPSLEIGIPSTGLNPAPDVETYQLGGYDINNNAPVNNVPVNNAPVNNVPVNNATDIQSTVVEPIANNIFEEEYYIKSPNPEGKTIEEKYELVGKRPMSDEKRQDYANNKNEKLQQIQKGMTSTNELLQDIDALINSKGFDTFFGRIGGFISSVDPDGLASQRLFNKILKGTALKNLVQMKLDSPNGATPFGQLNYSELQMVLEDIIALGDGGDTETARTMLKDFAVKMKNEGTVSLDFAKKMYGSDAADNFSYLYSNELVIDGETIYAIPGYVAKQMIGKGASALRNEYWYVEQNGVWHNIRNPKSKNKSKFLSNEDVRKGNY